MGKLRIREGGWRTPAVLMFVLTVAMAVGQGTYQALINNFAVERASFTGQDIGLLHTIREIPGLLAFTVLSFLMFVREQRLAFGGVPDRRRAGDVLAAVHPDGAAQSRAWERGEPFLPPGSATRGSDSGRIMRGRQRW